MPTDHPALPPRVPPRRRRDAWPCRGWSRSRSGATTSRKDASSEPPVRFACLFAGNGFHSKEWWAKGEGAQMELGKVLEPLQPFREKLLFLRGLYNAGGADRQHPQLPDRQPALRRAAGARRRDPLRRQLRPGRRRAAQGPDQGAEPGAGLRAVDRGGPQELLDDLQLAHLVELADDADAAGTVPGPGLRPALPRRGRPGRQERARRRAATMPPAAATRSAQSDQRRLDEYLSSVREVEQRIERAGKAGRLQGWRPTLDKPDMPRPADGIPQDIDEHMRLMCDILVLAFQTDTTRVCTLKLNNDHSSLRFPNLGVDYMIHHLLSHTDGGRLAEGEPVLHRAGRLHRRQARRSPGRRADAAGQLDDPVLSSMMTGNHDNDQLPVVMLGRGGGQIKTGRVLDYLGKPNRKMCSLYLSLMDKAGVRLDSFGDSQERLAEV